LLNESGLRFVNEVYNALDKDVRTQINVPTQWIVWIPKEKILTRLCWVLELEGDIIIRPWGSSNILLETNAVKFDAINSVSLKTLKKNNVMKESLNDQWKAILAAEELAEAAEEIEAIEQTPVEEPTPSEDIGKVE